MDAPNSMTPSRRTFLGTAAGGLILGFALPGSFLIGRDAAAAVPGQVNAWLTVGADNSITLSIGAAEMGQGTFSTLAQIMAEDLMVDYHRIRTTQGVPTMASPAPVGAAINTVGSSVTRRNFWALRDAAASAREMLVQAAMTRHGDSSRSHYSVTDGVITHSPSGKTFTYGAVADAASQLSPPANAPLVPDLQFRAIGKSLRRLDIPAKTNGSAVYGIDVRLPGMVYAVVKHCPTFGGRLAALPATPAGMIAVVALSVAAGTGRGTESTGLQNAVAVVGSNTWDAWQAAKSLRVSWSLPASATALNDAQILATAMSLSQTAPPYVAGAANPPGTLYTVEKSAQDPNTEMASAAKVVEAVYTLPYVAHACMEVLNCTVDYVPGVKCDVYAPTQSARSALSLVMTLTGLPESKVKINGTYLGGGLGRKSETDFIGQAVQVAMALQRPVQLFWPREEDFSRDQYRPMAVVRTKAGLDRAGNVAAWTYRNVSPSILGQRGSVLGARGDSQGYEASQDLPYAFGSRLTEWVSHPSPIPVGFWRSVGASINTFAVESMIDELAAAAGRDPYEYRRSLITDPRRLAVLDAAADLGGWNSPLARGRARGIAIGSAFGSIVAEVVELSGATSTGLSIARVSVVIDCYLAVNPDSIEAQLVGGVVHGLNAALYGRQSFANGVPQNRNFNRNRMLRGREAPQVNVRIMPNPDTSDRTVAIGGVGELGVPTLAPALANAYFRLTGKRQRSLPFFPVATMGGL